jgi:hypothetical protein
VIFHYFYGGTATVTVWQKDLTGKYVAHPAGTWSVSPSSGTTVSFKTPTGIVAALGLVYVTTTTGLASNAVTPGL